MVEEEPMSDKPCQSPSTAPADARRQSRRDLQRIAIAQKGALLSVLAFFLVMILLWNLMERFGIVLVYALFVVVIANVVSLALFAMRVYSSWAGLILGFSMVVPLLGMIALIAVHTKANRIFTENGYRVGLFGPRLSDLR